LIGIFKNIHREMFPRRRGLEPFQRGTTKASCWSPRSANTKARNRFCIVLREGGKGRQDKNPRANLKQSAWLENNYFHLRTLRRPLAGTTPNAGAIARSSAIRCVCVGFKVDPGTVRVAVLAGDAVGNSARPEPWPKFELI